MPLRMWGIRYVYCKPFWECWFSFDLVHPCYQTTHLTLKSSCGRWPSSYPAFLITIDIHFTGRNVWFGTVCLFRCIPLFHPQNICRTRCHVPKFVRICLTRHYFCFGTPCQVPPAMMIPWLHFTGGDNLIFKSLHPSSKGAIAAACVVLVAVALFERWLAATRVSLETEWRRRCVSHTLRWACITVMP